MSFFNLACDSIKRTVSAHKSDILVYAGVAMEIGAVGCAIAATPKALKTIESNKNELQAYRDSKVTVADDGTEIIIPDNIYKRQEMQIRLRGAGRVIKHYAVTTALASGGAYCILKGYGIVKGEKAAATALATSALAKLSEVKKNVIDDQGEDKWNQYYYSLEEQDVTEIVENSETGELEEVTTKKLVSTSECPFVGPFSFKIDKNNGTFRGLNGNRAWVENWLSIQEASLNSELHCGATPCMKVADIFDRLGIDDSAIEGDISPEMLDDYGWLCYGSNGEYNPDSYVAQDGKTNGPIDISFGDHKIDPETGKSSLSIVWGPNNDYVILTLNCAYIRGMRMSTKKYRNFRKALKENNKELVLDMIEKYPEIEK